MSIYILKWNIIFLSGVGIHSLRAREEATNIFNHPKFQHCQIVLGFFIFKFLLSTSDIVTDLLTAGDFFNNGHFYWGLLTALLIFAPFVARVIQICILIARCFKIKKDSNLPFFRRFSLQKNEGRLKVLLKEMPSLLWNFPLFLPIRQAGDPFRYLLSSE
jgi:hypothetical protein